MSGKPILLSGIAWGTALALSMPVGAQAQVLSHAELAPRVESIFEQSCAKCHGPQGVRKYEKAKGGFDFVLDLDRLATSRKLVEPGQPERSKLFRLIADNEMPDGAEYFAEEPLSDADKDVIRQWISALKDSGSLAERRFIGNDQVVGFIRDDLVAMDPRHRPLARYFTLTHLYNAGETEERLEIYRQGLAKALNSLSWRRRVMRPHVVDPDRTVFRVILDDLGWDEETWDLLTDAYAYYDDAAEYDPVALLGRSDRSSYGFSNEAVRPVSNDEEVVIPKSEPLAYLKADWFAAKATRPPLYHDILGIPRDARKLEARLGVDVRQNIAFHRVARAGIQDSGVSLYNRLLERHDSLFGAYWKSYDFADEEPEDDFENRRDLFARPLGPDGRTYSDTEAPESLFFGFVPFKHAGGEIIFSLPNGLQGYMLVDAVGERLDEAPTEIVQDRIHPRDGTIYTGISCMSCHADGMRDARDRVRGYAAASGKFFPSQIAEINGLYPPDDVFQALLKEDRERFRSALVRAGVDPALRDSAGYEPIFSLAERFEQSLSLAQAGAEFGLKPDAMLAALATDDDLEDLAARLLKIDLPRQQFAEYFDDIRRAVAGYRGIAKILVSFEDADYMKSPQRPAQASSGAADGVGLDGVAAAPVEGTEGPDSDASAEVATAAVGTEETIVPKGDVGAEVATAAAKIEEIRVLDGDVSSVQSELRRLGYDPGPVDGELGPKTQDAIRAFEEDVKRKTTVSLKEVELLLRLGKLG